MIVRRLPLILLCLIIAALAIGQGSAASASSAASQNTFAFAVLGDSRPGNENMDTLRKIVNELNLLRPRFALHTGDIISGSKSGSIVERQYERFYQVIGKLKMPFYVAVGNHEVGNSKAGEDLLKKLMRKQQLYHSFTYGSSYFAVLDSEIPGEAGKIAGSQLAWLQSDLAKNAGKLHKFIFVHRPLFPVDGHIGDSLDAHPQDRSRLIALLKQYHVDAVISGHEHLYNKSKVQGITEYITGGAGAPLYPSFKGTPMYHYLLVTVSGTEVTVAVIKPGSVLNDALTDR